MTELTKYEMQTLRECAGIQPPSPWGAALGAALEKLKGSGYITSCFGGEMTEKGWAAIRKGETIDFLGGSWSDLASRPAPEKTLLMLTGPSGYVIHTRFLALGYYDEEFRPSHGGPIRWLDVTGEALLDHGWVPTHWAYPIKLPE